MKHTTIAVDVAKNVFEIAVSRCPGGVSETHRLSRSRFLRFFAQQIAGPHRDGSLRHGPFLGSPASKARSLRRASSPSVRQALPPSQQDGPNRCQGASRGSSQQGHPPRAHQIRRAANPCLPDRFRSAWLATRTARINGVRGVLRELGIFIPLGAQQVVPRVRSLNEDADSEIPMALRDAFHQTCDEIDHLESLIYGTDQQLRALGRQLPTVERLLTIPGIGDLTATALVAFVGDVHPFRSCRHFASYLGLTPRERSSGTTRRLGRISKQGDAYLRMLLPHGARAVLWAAKKHSQPDRLCHWALELEHRRGHNKATIALANKLAPTVWAVWKRGTEYQSLPQTA